jgi:protein-tyrosine-phosphatase
VLREIGINVSSQESKEQDVVPARDVDLIIALGDVGKVRPTVSPRGKWKTWDISDPCREPGADLNAFRHARDEINNRIDGLFLDYWRNLA